MEKAANHGNRKEKGLTLLETVIALAVIVTVSLAAVSIAVYSSTSLSSSALKGFFQHEIDAFGDIYLSYPNGEDYSKAMLDYSGEAITLGEDKVFYYDASYKKNNEDVHLYLISFDFDGVDSLSLVASKKDGSIIVSRSLAR